MSVLVSGGSGLVGSAVVAALVARGHRPRVLLRSGPPPAGTDPYRVTDLCDAEAWRSAIDGVDAVVHAAGAMTQDPATLEWVNVRATGVAASVAAAAGCRRFVYLSSAAVYAPGRLVAADEAAALGPTDAYGQSKVSAEATVRAVLGISATILRPVSVYATTRSSPFARAVAAVVRAGVVPLVEDGLTPIDLVHADDLAQGVVAAAEGLGAGGTFNLAGGPPAPFLDLVRVAADALGVTVTPVRVSNQTAIDPTVLAAASVPRTVSDRWARAALGYAPTRDWRGELRACLATGHANGS